MNIRVTGNKFFHFMFIYIYFSYRNINILDCETETDLSDMRLEDLAAIPFFFNTEVGEIDGLAWQMEVDEDIRLRFNPIKCLSGKSK